MPADLSASVVPVVIVGAGPTGVTAATLLAQRGIRSIVLDRHHDVYPLPRAVHLDDEVHRILQQLGVADAFTAISRPARGMRLVDGQLRTLAEFRRDRAEGEHGWPQANMFDQPDLERLLRDNLRNLPQVRMVGGAEVQTIRELPGGPAPVRVTVRDEATGKRFSLWAYAVLGCDGANSVVRDQIGARLRSLRFDERWLVVDVRSRAQLPVWDGVYQVCDPARAATFMQIGADRYRWEFRLRDGEDLTGREALLPLLAPWTDGVAPEQLDVLRQTAYTFRAAVAERWRRGRVFLLGDAAHLTPPFIGQGMGAGLRDAANLAWKLALVLGDGADERLLDSYEAERRPHVTRVIRNAVAIGWAMTGGQDRAATARRLLLGAACRLPGVTGLALRTVSPRLRSGPLVCRRRMADPLPGTACPQPWITVDGIRRRFDDLVGESFTLLVRGPAEPSLVHLAQRLGAATVEIGPDSPLDGWLRRGHARAVVLRPDRVVLAAVPARGQMRGRLARVTGYLIRLGVTAARVEAGQPADLVRAPA